jgi:PKD domain
MRTLSAASPLRRLALLAATALVALGAAHPAGAAPVGTGGTGDQPHNPPPSASFTITPNPAMVSPEPLVLARSAARRAAAPLLLDPPVKFDASASTDDTGIADYAWDLDGNGTFERHGASPRVARRYAAVGTFAIRLRVTDTQGATHVTSRSLRIHRRPRAVLQPGHALSLPLGTSLYLSAKDSYDDNGIARFDWDLDGNGTFEQTSGRKPYVGVSLATLGPRTFRVRVTDIYGAADAASVTVDVVPAPPVRPTPPRVIEVAPAAGLAVG